MIVGIGLLAISCVSATPPRFETVGSHELWAPGIVSTARSEVRMTISPDGTHMLWGVLEWPEGPGKWEILESTKSEGGWSAPRVATFNSDANDFDPSFDPNGKGVYFFSNRAGGLGKDDIYFAPFDPATGHYGQPRNLGGNINSEGDEWAPVVSPDGAILLFATDGRGGSGKHDLFRAARKGDGWAAAVNIEELNTAAEDFDATFLHDGRSIVLSSGSFDGAINLYFAPWLGGKYGSRQLLDQEINSKEPDAWTFGPSIARNEPGVLYFTSHHAVNAGRADIYRIRYALLH